MDLYVVVKLESYDGKDTHLHCGDDHQDYLFCVLNVDAQGNAEVVDNGYRSYSEAVDAWPEARASRPTQANPPTHALPSSRIRQSSGQNQNERISETVTAIENSDYVEARLLLKNLVDDLCESNKPSVIVPTGALEFLLTALRDRLREQPAADDE